MYQILTIALRDLYTTFTDRNLLLIMIATPLVLSTIIGLAFGGGGSRALDIAIVNQDETVAQQGNDINLGDQIVMVFQSIGSGSTTDDITQAAATCPIESDNSNTQDTQQGTFALNMNVTLFDDADEARQAVERGQYVAAIIIPSNFSGQVVPQFGVDIASIFDGSAFESEQADIELYGNSSDTISTGIVKSILEGITNRMIAGNIIVQSTMETLLANPSHLADMQNAQADDFDVFVCAFDGTITSITLDQQALNEVQEGSIFVQIVVSIGSAQAAFFGLFTASASILSIYEEKKQGTYARLTVAPIPRWYLLAGNLVGTFATIVFQLLILMIGLITIASIVEGQLTLIWGTNVIHLILVILGLSISVSGIGVLLAGLAKDAQQAQIFSPIINILLAFFGGAFGIALPQSIQQFSIIYWGSDAFEKLSTGNTEVGLNVTVLLVLGLIMFTVGAWLFNRRIEG